METACMLPEQALIKKGYNVLWLSWPAFQWDIMGLVTKNTNKNGMMHYGHASALQEKQSFI